MCKQILWELRKSLLRRPFLILLILSLTLTAGLTLQNVLYFQEEANLSSWTFGEENVALNRRYAGKTSGEFDAIIAEQKALRAAHPERYEQYTVHDDEGNVQVLEGENELGWAQNRFLESLKPQPSLLPQVPDETGSVEALDELLATAPDGYQKRLLQKQRAWISPLPEVTILPLEADAASPFSGLVEGAGNGALIPWLSLFLILLACSPLYTQERRSDMEAILLSTRQGAKRTLRAKCLAAALAGAGIALLFQLTDLGIHCLFSPVPWDVTLASFSGGYSRIRFDYVGLTAGQAYLILLGLRVLGSMAFALLVTLFSSLSKSALFPMGVGLIFLFYPYILSCLPLSYYGSLSQVLETAGQGLAEAANWLTAASATGAQMAGFTRIWFGYYLNFFGYPVPNLLVAALFAGLIIVIALFAAPALFCLRIRGRIHTQKEAAHAHRRSHYQAV